MGTDGEQRAAERHHEPSVVAVGEGVGPNADPQQHHEAQRNGQRGNAYFIAMEFVQGKELRALFDRARKLGRTLDPAMACHVCAGPN